MPKKVAYICAPYAQDDKHIVFQHVFLAETHYAQSATDRGFVALVPHTMFPRATEADRAEIMATCCEIVACCDLLLVCGDRLSAGMAEEIHTAYAAGVQVEWTSRELWRQWCNETGDNQPDPFDDGYDNSDDLR